MDNQFFYGNDIPETEEKAQVVGAIVAGVGTAIGGVTSLIGAASQGTAMCGAKPTCISFSKKSNCAEKKRVWQECVATTQQIGLASVQAQQEIASKQYQADLDKQKKLITIAIIGAVTLTVIFLGTAIIKRRKANK
jgi:hypothetical protein